MKVIHNGNKEMNTAKVVPSQSESLVESIARTFYNRHRSAGEPEWWCATWLVKEPWLETARVVAPEIKSGVPDVRNIVSALESAKDDIDSIISDLDDYE